MTFKEAVERVVHTKTIAWHGTPLVSFKEMTGFEFWFVYYNEDHRDDPADGEKYMVRVTGSHFRDNVSYENFYWSTKLPKGIAEKQFEIVPKHFKVYDVARDIDWLYQSLVKGKTTPVEPAVPIPGFAEGLTRKCIGWIHNPRSQPTQ